MKKGVGVPHPFSVLERKRATVRPLIDSYYGVVLRGQSFFIRIFLCREKASAVGVAYKCRASGWWYAELIRLWWVRLLPTATIEKEGGCMAKLSDRQHKAMIARYAETNNLSLVAREFGVSITTVKRHVVADDETLEIVNRKKEENTQDILSFMESRKGKIFDILDKILEGLNDDDKIKRTGLQALATAYGIVIDKVTQNAPQTDSAQLQRAKEILGEVDGVIK